jgi:hypothetical protein
VEDVHFVKESEVTVLEKNCLYAQLHRMLRKCLVPDIFHHHQFDTARICVCIIFRFEFTLNSSTDGRNEKCIQDLVGKHEGKRLL